MDLGIHSGANFQCTVPTSALETAVVAESAQASRGQGKGTSAGFIYRAPNRNRLCDLMESRCSADGLRSLSLVKLP